MAEPGQPGTVLGVLRAAEAWLARRGVDAPRRSVELLLGRVLGQSRLQLYLEHDRPLAAGELARLRALVAERGRGVPVAYLLGDWGFFGLELLVSRDVLVPRPETEHLVELALERAPPAARCLDLGTGSGAIAVALAVQRSDLRLKATELSAAAAAVARRNVARHGVEDRVEVLEGSWWEPVRALPPFDLLVSNPPYVDPDRQDLLAADVKEFEPALALLAAPGDPASSYRAILAGIEAHLAPGAPLLLETGVGAAEPALELLSASPWLSDVELRPDLAGLPRYLLARRRV